MNTKSIPLLCGLALSAAASGLQAQTPTVTNQHYETNPLPVSTPRVEYGYYIGNTWYTTGRKEAKVDCSPGGTTGSAHAFEVGYSGMNATAFDWLSAEWCFDFGDPGDRSGKAILTVGGTVELDLDAVSDAAGYLWADHQVTFSLPEGKNEALVYVEGGVDSESGNVSAGTITIGTGPLSWQFSPSWKTNSGSGTYPITGGGMNGDGEASPGRLFDKADCWGSEISKVTLSIDTSGYVHAYADGYTLGGFDSEAECNVNVKTTCAVSIDGSSISLADLPTSSGSGKGKGQGGH